MADPKQPPVGGKMSFMQRISKAVDKAGKQTSKAIVKGKIMAIQKIAHAEVTPEKAEITGALERLKATKNEISALADVARYLYEARINQANYQVDMSHQLRDCRTADADGWSKLAVAMGMSMSRLESIHSEHCERMKEELVAPLEKFRDVDVNEVQKLKLKYKEAKSAYDVAIAKERGAKDSGQAQKMQLAMGKKHETEDNLDQMRSQFLKAVEALERQKNTELLGSVKEYWGKYVSFAKAQHNALQATPLPDDIDPSNYEHITFATTTPGSGGRPADPSFGGPEFVTNYNENNIEHAAEQKAAEANGLSSTAYQSDNINNNNNNNNVTNPFEVNGHGSNANEYGNEYGNENDYQNEAQNNEYNNEDYNENHGNYDDENQGYDDNNNNDHGGYGDNNEYDENGGYNEHDADEGSTNENGNANGTNNPFYNGSDAANGANAAGAGTGAAGGDPLDFDPYQEQ